MTGDGGLECWGFNRDGRAQGRSGPFRAIAAGWHDTCALRLDGSAFCQGRHSLDPPAGAFTQIAVGLGYACGLPIDGGPVCWNGAGQIAARPGDFAALSAGLAMLCTLSAAGQPECWALESRHPGDAPSGDAGEPGGAVPGEVYRGFGDGYFKEAVELFPGPGGGLAVAERWGRISLAFTSPEAPARLLLDLTGRVYCCDEESGLLSTAVDPEFQDFPYLYVWYTTRREGGYFLRLSRIPWVDGVFDAAAELVILELPPGETPTLHNGGAIRFGPDGRLYLGIGDNEQPPEAQNPASLGGSIIRIDIRGATPEQPYRIPLDNPLVDTPGARPEIWAYGLRNPWRMSFDSQGRLWVGDVGEGAQEEISLAAPGANLGWPVFEGYLCRAGETACAALNEALAPVFAYDQPEGCAIIWGGEYRGWELPQLRGAHLFTDYCSIKIWALEGRPETGWQRREIAEVDTRIISFGTDAAGEMYLLPVSGPLVRLDQLISAEPAEP